MQTWPAPVVPRIPGSGPVVRVRGLDGALVDAASGPVARMYVCGITPYDATHLGHASTAIAFDLLHRAWLDQGCEVRHVSNVTDVDDPLLERAAVLGVDWAALAATEAARYAEDMTSLAVIPPDVYLGAVESIPQVVSAVGRLLERGLAYRVQVEDSAGGEGPEAGDVYADTEAEAVEELPGHTRDQSVALFAERGGDPGRPGKRNPLDPLLWRRERPGEPSWDGGSLGWGRPGWHIECAAIAEGALGESFDVQGGGRDLCFPHHAMSTAHARALGGQGARIALHTGMVKLDGRTMSKSRGNLVLVSTLRRQGVDPMAVRLAVLSHHYSDDWEWDDAVIDEASARLGQWRVAVSGNGGPDAGPTLAEIRASLADDLDAPRALAAMDRWAQEALNASGGLEGAPGVIARAVDALLGVRL